MHTAAVAILVSDGEGGSIEDLTLQADKLRDRGVIVVAIGIEPASGSMVSRESLEAVASDQNGEELVFMGSFTELENMLFVGLDTVGAFCPAEISVDSLPN